MEKKNKYTEIIHRRLPNPSLYMSIVLYRELCDYEIKNVFEPEKIDYEYPHDNTIIIKGELLKQLWEKGDIVSIIKAFKPEHHVVYHSNGNTPCPFIKKLTVGEWIEDIRRLELELIIQVTKRAIEDDQALVTYLFSIIYPSVQTEDDHIFFLRELWENGIERLMPSAGFYAQPEIKQMIEKSYDLRLECDDFYQWIQSITHSINYEWASRHFFNAIAHAKNIRSYVKTAIKNFLINQQKYQKRHNVDFIGCDKELNKVCQNINEEVMPELEEIVHQYNGKLNQKQVKETAKTLYKIRDNPRVTRVEIAKTLGISVPTFRKRTKTIKSKALQIYLNRQNTLNT